MTLRSRDGRWTVEVVTLATGDDLEKLTARGERKHLPPFRHSTTRPFTTGPPLTP
jgi:hypothetical protein